MIMIIVMKKCLKKDNKTLEYNQGEKSLKMTAIIYAGLGCLLKKMNSCQNNPEKSCTERKARHTSSSKTKKQLDCQRGKDFMERFC